MKFELLLNTFNSISDDIELFLAEKNFIMDIHEDNNYSEIVNDIEELRNNNRSLAYFYLRLIRNNSDKVIELMGNYIKLSHSRGELDLSPIEYFIHKKEANQNFEAHKEDFLREVYPIIWELDLFKDLANIGFVITLLDVEYPTIGEKLMVRILKNPPIFASIDNQINSKLIDDYYSTNKITPFPVMRDIGEMIECLKTNVGGEIGKGSLEENAYELYFRDYQRI
jgi:hypothetical protein